MPAKPARIFSIARHSLSVSETVQVKRAGYIGHSRTAKSRELIPNAVGPTVFEMPLPGTSRAVQMQIVDGVSELRKVPVLQSDGTIREVSVELMNISDSMSLYGVMARSDAGVFATIGDRSSEDRFLQVRPHGSGSVGGEQPHVVEEVALGSKNVHRTCGHARMPLALSESESNTSVISFGNSSGVVSSDKPDQPETALSNWRAVELLTVLPSEFARDHSDEYLVASVLNTVAGANLFFEQIELQIQVSGVQVFRNPATDPYASASARKDALSMLETLRRQWAGQSAGVQAVNYDAVAVLGRGDYDGIYGYAYPKTSCVARDWAALFATQGGLDRASEVSLSATLAHEIGHILGMSHDRYDPRDTLGPYLMEASFVANPTGFSSTSVASYKLHAGVGSVGGSCFHSIPAPSEEVGGSSSASLVLAGGTEERIQLREGEVYRTPIVVIPARTQAKYSVLKLPRGATFNSFSGVLRYAPDATAVVGRRGRQEYEALVQVHAKNVSATKRIVFDVIDSNRAPQVRTRLRSNNVRVRAGKQLRLSFLAVDPDAGDRVRMLFGSRRLLSQLKGRQQIRERGAKLDFAWTPPKRLRGRFVLSFVARDQAGQASRRLVTVQVVR